MTTTVPDNHIGIKALGYTLLALPSNETKQQLTNLLRALSAELPGVLWSMPAEQLHITLCEIIQTKDYSQDKEALYNLHKDQYENVPARLLSKTPKFTVTFDLIEASPQAIIVRCSNSDNFNDIRSRLIAEMELPGETRTPPDITHSSIARYLQTIDLELVQTIVAKHKINIAEEITGFKLVRTEMLPLQKYEVLKDFRLAKND